MNNIWIVLCAVTLGTTVPAYQSAADEAVAVAHRFFVAFEKRDFPALKALFAPDATYTSLRRDDSGGLERKHYDAEDWLVAVRPQIERIPSFTVDVLTTTHIETAFGVSVSVYYRDVASGGGWRVVNEGVDTLNLIRVDGKFLILQYTAFENMGSGN